MSPEVLNIIADPLFLPEINFHLVHCSVGMQIHPKPNYGYEFLYTRLPFSDRISKWFVKIYKTLGPLYHCAFYVLVQPNFLLGHFIVLDEL